MATLKEIAIIAAAAAGIASLAPIGYFGIRDTTVGVVDYAWNGAKREYVNYDFHISADQTFRFRVPRSVEKTMDNFIDARKRCPATQTALEIMAADADDTTVDGEITAEAVRKLSNGYFRHAAESYTGPFPVKTIGEKTAPHFEGPKPPVVPGSATKSTP